MKVLHEKHYFIKDASEMTGISEQLIRKWEKRYHLIQPKRLDNGYRVYSMNDILLLKDIKKKRDEGHSIKKSIQKVLVKRKEEERASLLYNVKKSPYVDKLVMSGTNYKEERIASLLKQANDEYGLDQFLVNTVQPFLLEIGELWHNQTWDESQETVSSLVVRDFLSEISRNFEYNEDGPHVLGINLPGEYHEIPLQMLLLQMSLRGWNTTRTGSSQKFSSIETLIEHIQPTKVLFSATTLIPFQEDKTLFEKLDLIGKKHPHISFYIGGSGVWSYTEIIKPKYMTISYSIEDITQDLNEHQSQI